MKVLRKHIPTQLKHRLHYFLRPQSQEQLESQESQESQELLALMELVELEVLEELEELIHKLEPRTEDKWALCLRPDVHTRYNKLKP